MVARLRQLKAREMMRLLDQLGFVCIRQKGSHAFYQHHDGRTTVVPVHRGEDIGRGLLRKILRDIDVTPDELADLM